MQKIIFTDLDGTLLDDNYSYEKAAEGLSLIKKNKIPLIICSSKTRAEIEYYQEKMGIEEPFICENGGAIFIPLDYFNFYFNKKIRKYNIIELGKPAESLFNDIIRLKIDNIRLFNEMSDQELAKDSGLPIKEARLAKQREYGITFKILDMSKEHEVLDMIRSQGLNFTFGGRYYHIMSKNDKGKAVDILKKLFLRKYMRIETIGIGDSENDFGMLDNVDEAYLVKGRDGSYASEKFNKADGIGPEGWNEIILKEFNS